MPPTNEFKVGDWVRVTTRDNTLQVIGRIVKFRKGGIVSPFGERYGGIEVKTFWKEDPEGIDIEGNDPNWWPYPDDVYIVERWNDAV